MAEDARHTPEYRELYKLRQEKIERVFADAKEKHGMRYTQYRGLAQVTNWVKLKFVAMNLKKLAMWKWKASLSTLISCISKGGACGQKVGLQKEGTECIQKSRKKSH